MRRVWLAWVAVVGGCCPRGATEKPGECITWYYTAGQCDRSEFVETALEDPLLVRLDFTYTWQGDPTVTDAMTWTVPRSRLAEVRAAVPETIPCERMRSAGCAPTILPAHEFQLPPAGPGLAERERICAGTAASPLLPDVAALAPAELAAAFAPAIGPWQRTGVEGAAATYARGDEQVRIEIEDRIHTCGADVAATDTLLDTEAIAEPGMTRRQRVMSATSAVLVTWLSDDYPPHRWLLVMWIGGRCRVAVERVTKGFKPDPLAEVGRAVDVAHLERICAALPSAGAGGGGGVP